MPKFFLQFLFILLPINAFAYGLSDYFSNLKSISISSPDFKSVNFYYHPDLTVIINEKNTKLSEKYGRNIISLARFSFEYSENVQNNYLITFEKNNDAHPAFRLYKMDDDDLIFIGEIVAYNLYFKGTRSIYSSGHVQAMYDKKRKFLLDNDQIREIKQPFYYVGIDSHANQAIVMYTSEELGEEVGHLPKGANLTVLLEDNDYYLLRTSFGLVGWMKIEKSPQDQVIQGLYYVD